MKQVDILLATYNGEKFLREQIQSLLNQTHPSIRILARDDASQDSTCRILSGFPLEWTPNEKNGGVVQTFSQLLQSSTAPYVMFSDQDDVWLPHKVELALEAMPETDRPVLVHTDLKVVNEALETLHPSYWKYTHLNPMKTKTLGRLLAQNVVTGCTMMMNRALVNLSQPLPKEALMHDWWIALVAAAFGEVIPLSQQTILYRQHSSNCLGAKGFYSLSSLKRFKVMNEKKRLQALAFAKQYADLLTSEQLELLDSFVQLDQQSFFKKISSTLQYGFYRQGFSRNLVSLLLT